MAGPLIRYLLMMRALERARTGVVTPDDPAADGAAADRSGVHGHATHNGDGAWPDRSRVGLGDGVGTVHDVHAPRPGEGGGAGLRSRLGAWGDAGAQPDALPVTERLARGYDQLMFSDLVEECYGGSDFCNWGYWLGGTRTQREASENLVEMLLAFAPKKRGTVLDVACGKGATSRYLLRYFPAAQVTGINISESQLQRCREIASGARFIRMDATALDFPDASFDNVICVEAAFHFETRERFLHEALRVLRPGGRLMLSDILFTRHAEVHGSGLHAQNWLPGPDSYRQLLSEVGFGDVEVIDATDPCWRGYEANQDRFCREKMRGGGMDLRTYRYLQFRRVMRALSTRLYLLATGVKPVRAGAVR
jgi:SAM-dependent methyltransferase